MSPCTSSSAWATSNGIEPAAIAAAAQRLEVLRSALGFDDILAQLSPGSLQPALAWLRTRRRHPAWWEQVQGDSGFAPAGPAAAGQDRPEQQQRQPGCRPGVEGGGEAGKPVARQGEGMRR